MQNSRKLILIGISALAALLLLIYGLSFLRGNNPFRAYNNYFVVYDNVTGLSVSAPVNASGVKVGQVKSMAYMYENPGHVKVELDLDGELKIPAGSVAALETDILGTTVINLQMPLTTDYITPGSTIKGTQAVGLMDNVSNDLLPGIVNILPKVDSLLVSVTALAADPALAASIRRMNDITANLASLSANLAKASQTMPGVMLTAQHSMDNIASLTANIDSLSNELKNLPLSSTMANVEAISADVAELTAQLKQPDSTLGMLINDPELYNSLNRTVASLDSLITDVKAQPKRYLKFSVF